MHRCLIFLGFTATFTLTGCCDRKPPQTDTPLAMRADLPDPPPPSRGAKPSEEDVIAVKPVVADLVKRAEANDEGFFRKLMPNADAAAVADMIRRVKGADMNGTYAQKLAVYDASTGHLDYHDPSHVQVDLKRTTGQPWTISRLWFCR